MLSYLYNKNIFFLVFYIHNERTGYFYEDLKNLGNEFLNRFDKRGLVSVSWVGGGTGTDMSSTGCVMRAGNSITVS